MSGTGKTGQGGRPLADWVDGCIAPTLARFGFGEVDIVSGWADIAGPRIAACAEPIGIKWPRKGAAGQTPGTAATPVGGRTLARARDHSSEPSGGRLPATLVVRVEGAFALELQHLAPLLIERINAHLGWRCIGKVALRQAPLIGREPHRASPPPPDPAALAAARDRVAAIDDEGLRAALERLGARVLAPR